MSLDALIQEVLVAEQQLSERTKRLRQIKVEIIRCKEEIESSSVKNENINRELDNKAQQLFMMKLKDDLVKKHEEQMEGWIQELLCQQSGLQEHLDRILAEAKEEEERFLRQITQFNSDFSLCGNRRMVAWIGTRAEILQLEKEVDAVNEEMELMNHTSVHRDSTLREKKTLQLELKALDITSRDLDRKLSEAEARTESLRAESLAVSQKPHSDATCLRLKKELEMHKEGNLKILREALSSEIQFLQSVSK